MRARIAVLAAAIAAVVAFQAAVAVPESTAGAPTTDLTLSLDCDLSVSGTQSACTVAGPAIDVILTNNSGSAIQAGSFDFTILDFSNLPQLSPYTSNVTGGTGRDGNPDFASAISSMQWTCNTPLPDADTDADGNPVTQQSFLGCTNGSGNGFVVGAGASVVLARVNYNGNSLNNAPLTIESAIFRDQTQTERGSCAAVTVAMECNGATLTSGPTEVNLSLDCDANAAGIQSACTQFPGAMFDVDVVATNIGPTPFQLGAFGGTVLNPDIARLVARTPGMDLPVCDPSGYNCNPDFNQVALTGGWACSPPPPEPDSQYTTEPGQDSFIQCMNGDLSGPFVAPGASIVLWKIHYRVPAAAPTGSVPLDLYEAGVYDESFGELGTCDPVIAIAIACNDATITIANVSMSLDCTPHLPGVQSTCMVSNMSPSRDVRVVIKNHGTTGIVVGAFGFRLQNPDITRLFAPTINPPGYSNDNPDATAAAEGPGWACGAPDPVADDPGTIEPGQDSNIDCFNGATTGFMINAGASVDVATVHYNIVAGADPGPVQLTLTDADVYNASFVELGSCGPVLTKLMPCNPLTITLYCPIDMGDVNNDGRVNVADMGITAVANGVLPAPAHLDQNFDGIINVADRGIIASLYGKFVVQCP